MRLFGRLADGGVAGGVDVFAGPVPVLVVDLAAGEHPHAAEGDLGVLAQHQGLGPVGAISKHDNGGCRPSWLVTTLLCMLCPGGKTLTVGLDAVLGSHSGRI